MNDSHYSRRELIGGLTVASVATNLAATQLAAAAESAIAATPPAFRGQHPIQPLPFNPARLNGLSEKLLVSHHDNNYAGAVRNLNRVEQELATVNKDTPAFMVGGLRQNELTFRNSMTLHEAYFGNLGGDGKASGGIASALRSAYGSFENWELHFRATGNSLGGGSGWTVLAYELTTGELRTHIANHHTQALSSAMPLLVLDMYEHSYQMDFGAAAGRYIDAFISNINWDAVNQRHEQAQQLAKLLRR
jgi:superoxide dismutase, Fe-Mn family